MPRFTLKINIFSFISSETPEMCAETSEWASFSSDNCYEGPHA